MSCHSLAPASVLHCYYRGESGLGRAGSVDFALCPTSGVALSLELTIGVFSVAQEQRCLVRDCVGE